MVRGDVRLSVSGGVDAVSARPARAVEGAAITALLGANHPPKAER